MANGRSQQPFPPTSSASSTIAGLGDAVLEFVDGSAYGGISFGAHNKSVAGECVFQTGNELEIELRLPALIAYFHH